MGSHLVDRLLARGDEVHVLVRKSSDLRWLKGKKIHFHYGDVIGDLSGFSEGVRGADLLFHVAAVVRARNVSTYFEVNAGGTDNILKACLKENPPENSPENRRIKRVVVVTSLAAHGPNPGEAFAKEEDESRPLTDYGKSKLEQEKVALRYADRLPIAIVRPPAIYGPRDDQVFGFFRMIEKRVAFLPGRGKRMVSLAHVQDVVTGLILAAERQEAVGEIFFVGEDRNHDWEEAADLIGQALNRSFVKIRIPKPVVFTVAAAASLLTKLSGHLFPLNLAYARNFMQPNWGIDVSKAQKCLGFRSAYPLSRGVQETADWYLKEHWLRR